MKIQINNILVLNGPMLIRVVNDEIIISVYQNEIKIPFESSDEPRDILERLDHKKGSITSTFTSDIFNVFEKEITLQDFESDTVQLFLAELLESSIQFIAKISKEEDMAVLIQNSYNQASNYVLSTIGLIDDARIIFAEIRQKER